MNKGDIIKIMAQMPSPLVQGLAAHGPERMLVSSCMVLDFFAVTLRDSGQPLLSFIDFRLEQASLFVYTFVFLVVFVIDFHFYLYLYS